MSEPWIFLAVLGTILCIVACLNALRASYDADRPWVKLGWSIYAMVAWLGATALLIIAMEQYV